MKEFESINADILNNSEFNKLRSIAHHGITRYDHSLRVARYTYFVTRKLHLNYKEATRAALLHDFFTDEVVNESSIKKLTKHPLYAVENAKKYFDLTPMQENIIATHMFPVGLNIPKYIESWVVDILDDVAAIYERVYTFHMQLSAASTFLFLLLINYVNLKLF